MTNLIRTAEVKSAERSRTLKGRSTRLSAPFTRLILPPALGACLLVAGCGPEPEPPATFHPSTPEEAVALTYFTSTVKPVLRENCYRCHFGLNHKSNFNMGTRELLLKGGSNGTDVIPGHPESSLLVTLVRHEGKAEHPGPMPPKGKLSDAEIASIQKWIGDGAIMDR